jgi:hypothetical protein
LLALSFEHVSSQPEVSEEVFEAPENVVDPAEGFADEYLESGDEDRMDTEMNTEQRTAQATEDDTDEREDKAYGGTLINANTFKNVVLVRTHNGNGVAKYCHGVVFKADWVLVPVGCVSETTEASFINTQMWAGGIPNLLSWNSAQGVFRDFQVAGQYARAFSQYSAAAPLNGISMIQIYPPFVNNGAVQLFTNLPDVDSFLSGYSFFAATYGKSSATATQDFKLRQVTSLSWNSLTKCGAQARATSQLCVGGNTGKGMCYADLGAPLFSNRLTTTGGYAPFAYGLFTQQVGTTPPCGRAGASPSMYSRIDRSSREYPWMIKTWTDNSPWA